MSGTINHRERTTYVVRREDMASVTYPDVSLDELRVKVPRGFRAPDPRNPFVVSMERGSDWIEQADAKGQKLTPEKMVKLAQYITGTVLNDRDLANLRGLARDMISPPPIPVSQRPNALKYEGEQR